MTTERTFAIIKPDAVAKGFTGQILTRIEQAGFSVRGMRLAHLSKRGADGCYGALRGPRCFGGLADCRSSGPCVVVWLEAEGAILRWRTVRGATDPAKAEAGTLRKEFGGSIETNATHGSDAPETAAF